MNFNISIPPATRANMQTVLDSIMNNVEGRDCVLYFPPVIVPGNDNQMNPAPNSDISNNVWTAGMPSPLYSQQSHDPYSDAQHTIPLESTGIIRMVIYPEPSRFNSIFPAGQQHEEGTIVSRGYVSDLPNVLNCTRMETYVDVGTNHYTYVRAGEPVMPGTLVPSRYFYTLWKRV